MKSIVLLFSLLSLLRCPAQVEIINHSLTDSSLGIVFIGVDNEIEVKTKTSGTKIRVTVDNGKITATSAYKYLWSLTDKKNSVISVTADGKVIGQRLFRVDISPDPIASVAGVKDSFATIDQLVLNPFLLAVFRNSVLRSRIMITSFTMILMHDGDQPKFEISGNQFPEQAIRSIRSLAKNDRILFDNIQCATPNDRPKALPPIYVMIK